MTMSEYLEFHRGINEEAYTIYLNKQLDGG